MLTTTETAHDVTNRHPWFERTTRLTAALIVAASLVAAVAFINYPGSAAPFWGLHAACVLFVWLACQRPQRYGVLALAAFFTMGHWLKLMAHLATATGFVEPIGRFDGSAAEWDRALTLTGAALAGAAAVRGLDLWRTRRTAAADGQVQPRVPQLFVEQRLTTWGVTVLAILLIAAWNIHGAFLMIGVDVRQLLPLRLHMVLAYWLLSGGAIWMALMLTWEQAVRGPLSPAWILAVAGEGLVASVSMLSRSVYVFRLLPPLLVLLTRHRNIIRWPSFTQAAAGIVVLALGVVASVGSSMFTRAAMYPAVKMPPLHAEAAQGGRADAAMRPSGTRGGQDGEDGTRELGETTSATANAGAASGRPTTTDRLRPSDLDLVAPAARRPTAVGPAAARVPKSAEQHEQALRQQRLQLVHLMLARWIGTEGVLATSSHPARGARLFRLLVTDNPANGTHTYYQRISAASYTPQEGFTFLTLAGVVGILAASDSTLVAAAGLFVVVGLLILLEEFGLRATGSVLASATAAAGVANLVAQMNFPYNTAVLWCETMLVLAALGGMLRLLPIWRGGGPAPSHESSSKA